MFRRKILKPWVVANEDKVEIWTRLSAYVDGASGQVYYREGKTGRKCWIAVSSRGGGKLFRDPGDPIWEYPPNHRSDSNEAARILELMTEGLKAKGYAIELRGPTISKQEFMKIVEEMQDEHARKTRKMEE